MTGPMHSRASERDRVAGAGIIASVPPTNLGAVFTRRWVSELILDLCGYTSDEPLFRGRAIEPACGNGAFVKVMVERMLESCRRHDVPVLDAQPALLALDVDPQAVEVARAAVMRVLVDAGVELHDAVGLAIAWVQHGDFLLEAGALGSADWVVGNPPYLRIEDVSPKRMAKYRRAWRTMSGRADVYVGFYEAGLSLLEPEGRLAFICADRWMRNGYGAGLRKMIEERFAMDACIVMHAVDAFEERVSAYPAINVLRRGDPRPTLAVDASDELDSTSAARLVKVWRRGLAPVAVDSGFRASWVEEWPRSGQSWPDGTPEALALLADLEHRHPTLAESGVTVAVGVATGAESVYVVEDPALVEEDRLVKTVGAKETATGGIDWRGRFLVSPWDEDGLVDLRNFPRLSAYLDTHRSTLESRHVARANPAKWWRTIDRIHPSVATRPKLLIPDLKDRIHPVLDQGQFVPLHNLYYVTSDLWDLAELGGLLLSDFANLFVEAYSVRMANGYLRVSAQYLRRVRIPSYDRVDRRTRRALRTAFWNRDVVAANEAASAAYHVDVSLLEDGRLRLGR